MSQVTVSSPVTQATLAFTFSSLHGTKREQESLVICTVHYSFRQKQLTPLHNLLPESMLTDVEVDRQFPSLWLTVTLYLFPQGRS